MDNLGKKVNTNGLAKVLENISTFWFERENEL